MDIPKKVIEAIKEKAVEDWPGDQEMQDYQVSHEVDGYRDIMRMDFLGLSQEKDEMIRRWFDVTSSWEEAADLIKDELKAYAYISTFPMSELSGEEVAEINVAVGQEETYVDRERALLWCISKFKNIKRTREKVDPIKPLLVRLESIIGQECYNGNIQNYGPGGEWEGEGRSFRYPVTFNVDEEETVKRKTVNFDIAAEELVSGRYAFGANELNIYRGLIKVLDYLREEYGFDPSRKRSKNDH